MKRYNIRNATREDIIDVCGGAPPFSTRTWAVDYDGELAAVAGVQYTPRCVLVFSDMKKIDVPNITIWRAALELFDKIKALNKPLNAVCTGEFINAGPFLKRLGFKQQDNIENMEVYSWQTH